MKPINFGQNFTINSLNLKNNMIFVLIKTEDVTCVLSTSQNLQCWPSYDLPAKLQCPHILLASAHKGQDHLQTLQAIQACFKLGTGVINSSTVLLSIPHDIRPPHIYLIASFCSSTIASLHNLKSPLEKFMNIFRKHTSFNSSLPHFYSPQDEWLKAHFKSQNHDTIKPIKKLSIPGLSIQGVFHFPL